MQAVGLQFSNNSNYGCPLMDALVYGDYKINIEYIKSQTHITFHQAFIAQLVECQISDQKVMGSSPTSANETMSKNEAIFLLIEEQL